MTNYNLPDETEMIDRNAYEPAYAQLANILRRKISGGVFRPGDQLPSEAQLCREYQVSPMTVRRSINLLADQDVVSTVQGKGTFVKHLELSTATFQLQKLHDLFTNATVKLLDARIVSADERTARQLQIDVGQKVIYLSRLLSRDNEAISFHRAYLVYDPTRPTVEAEMDVTSLQGLLANANNEILKNGTLTIEVTLMNKKEAAILNAELPCAAFYLEHVFCGFDNMPISWGWFICPGDQLSFTTHIGLDY